MRLLPKTFGSFRRFRVMFAIGLALLLSQTPDPVPYPKPVHETPTGEYLAWPGFGFLPAAGRSVANFFAVPGDWTEIQAAVGATSGAVATEWPVRFFVLKRVDQVKKLDDGTLYEEQSALETVDVDRINRAIALLQATVSAETGGTLKLVPQITVDSEPLLLGARTLDRAISDYVFPRVNGGKYTAEDKVYRGPYESVFVLHPVPALDSPESLVNGTPTTPISVYGFPGYEAEGELALHLLRRWTETLKPWSQATGLRGPLANLPQFSPLTNAVNPLAYVPDGNWAALLKGADLPAADIDARLHLSTIGGDPLAGVNFLAKKINGLGYKGLTCSAVIETDPAQGSILAYSEKGESRDGGLEFPVVAGAPIVPAKTGTLAFWARSSSKDPMALELSSSDGKIFDVSLGPDLPGAKPVYQADFTRDGSWRRLKIDLKQTGLDSIDQIRLLPTPNSHQHSKITLGPIRYDFASFEATNDPPDGPYQTPTPDSSSADAWRRARWANTAHPSPQLLQLLKDPEWFVRLNAIQRYIAEPDPSAEAALTENANLAIDGPTAAAALDALWKLGTPTAKAVIHQTLQTGITEMGKAEAARIIGDTKDTALAPELIPLQQSRGLATRMAVVDALGNLPGENAAIIRMTFLYQDDPELKLEVTKTSDGSDEYQWKKLLWSSVNEGSDAVRLVSYEKLIQSTDPTAKAGGYGGVKDDSIEVRIQILQYLKNHPSEENRNALRQAVADRSARVRAAAIEAFSVLDKGVKEDELGAALTDSHPVVLLALIDLAKSKKFSLPASTTALIAASADPQVQAAAQSLP
jgi:HEAT repeat protein